LAIFLRYNVTSQFSHIVASNQKVVIFVQFFRRKYSQNHNIGPWRTTGRDRRQ
jgi:hypothetical protein